MITGAEGIRRMEQTRELDPKDPNYLGLHRVKDGWVCREWAPEAVQVYFTGEFNGWDREQHPMMPLGNGCWVVYLHGGDTLWEGCRVATLAEGPKPRRVEWHVGGDSLAGK